MREKNYTGIFFRHFHHRHLLKIETVTRWMRNHKKYSRAGNGSNFSFNQIQNVIEKPILNMRLEFVDNITRFLKWATWNEKD